LEKIEELIVKLKQRHKEYYAKLKSETEEKQKLKSETEQQKQ
jgi:hypothetical protein